MGRVAPFGVRHPHSWRVRVAINESENGPGGGGEKKMKNHLRGRSGIFDMVSDWAHGLAETNILRTTTINLLAQM